MLKLHVLAVLPFLAPLPETVSSYDVLVAQRAALPILAVEKCGDDGLIAWHGERDSTLFRLPPGEELTISIATGDPPKLVTRDDGIVDGTLPRLRAEWKDAQGVVWEVCTPVQSTTPAGVQRAVNTHHLLVAALQAQHPPAPIPVPVPPP